MTRRYIYIILGAILVAALIALAWWWFFHRATPKPAAPSGSFGTAQNTTGGIGTQSGTETNTANTVSNAGGTGGTQTNIPNTGTGETQTSQNGLTYQNQTVYNPTYGVITIPGTPGSVVTTITQGAGSTTIQTGGITYTGATGGFPAAIVPPTYTAPVYVPPGSTGVIWLSALPSGGGNTFSNTGTNGGGNGNTASGGGNNATTPGNINTDPGSVAGNTTPGSVFNPLATNGINTANPTGGVLPNIGGTSTGGSNNGLGLGGALAGAAIAGGISCGAAQAISAVASALGLSQGAATAAPGAATAAAGVASEIPKSAFSVQVVDSGTAIAVGGNAAILTAIAGQLGVKNGHDVGNTTTNTFWSCIARTVAKTVLQQLTASVVNWINSGFNGSPSFVTQPEQFFQNVADNAAGQYIKGSALSFLCSPFQLQIKIAIAQSYANRNAQSCTLTGVINNINNFMNGDFSSGGWAGMLAFTGTPTNNPYGAYAYASVGLNYTVQTATGAQQRQLTLGSGFLDFTQNKNCNTVATAPSASASKSVTTIPNPYGTGSLYNVCDVVHTTPGKAIADQLGATQNSVFGELGMAQSFDQIISALVTQLIGGIQGGLANLSNGGNGYESNFYTPDQLQAQAAAQTLLVQMQNSVGYNTQYAGVEQGAIGDIENAQQQLNTLYNCWVGKAQASSTNAAIAAQNATLASTTLNQMNGQIVNYNNNITNANAGITALQNLESAALSAASQGDTAAVTQGYNAAQAQGQILRPTDLTTAQQDRTTLQSQLGALNTSTATGLQQCNAF